MHSSHSTLILWQQPLKYFTAQMYYIICTWNFRVTSKLGDGQNCLSHTGLAISLNPMDQWPPSPPCPLTLWIRDPQTHAWSWLSADSPWGSRMPLRDPWWRRCHEHLWPGAAEAGTRRQSSRMNSQWSCSLASHWNCMGTTDGLAPTHGLK